MHNRKISLILFFMIEIYIVYHNVSSFVLLIMAIIFSSLFSVTSKKLMHKHVKYIVVQIAMPSSSTSLSHVQGQQQQKLPKIWVNSIIIIFCILFSFITTRHKNEVWENRKIAEAFIIP